MKLDLPAGPPLPPPPPMEHQAFVEYWLWRMDEFYKSEHRESWEQRTWAEMEKAEPFVWKACLNAGSGAVTAPSER